MGGVRSLARGAGMIAILLLLLAPSWLGPAMGALARAFGAVEHVCACGMVQGKCGCPECARLELRRSHGDPAQSLDVVRSTCADDEAIAASASAPTCLPPDPLRVLASAPQGAPSQPTWQLLTPFAGEPPPTPPPRTRAL